MCPAEARPERWQAFTFPCTTSEQEMLALMDIYSTFLGTLPDALTHHAQSAAATCGPACTARTAAFEGARVWGPGSGSQGLGLWAADLGLRQ